MRTRRLLLLLLLSWVLPVGTHLAFTALFTARTGATLRRIFPAARAIEPGVVSVQLGGRFDIEDARIETSSLSARLPFTTLSPRWFNLVGSDPFFLLETRGPSLALRPAGTEKGRGGSGKGRSALRSVLARFQVRIDDGRFSLDYGNHRIATEVVSGGGDIRRGLKLRGRLLRYEGTLGLWVGKDFEALVAGNRLQHIAISFIKLFSSEGRELELTGKADRLAGDALEYSLTLASGTHFLKSAGRLNLGDRILDGTINYSISIGTLQRFARSFGISPELPVPPRGFMAGDLQVRFNDGIERLLGPFALSRFSMQHHLLATAPVAWDHVSGNIDYSRLKRKERLHVDVLVKGTARGVCDIQKTPEALEVRFNVPVQSCAALFGAIPPALVPTVGDMRLGGETGLHFASHIPLADLTKLTAHMDFSGGGCFVQRRADRVDIEGLKGTPTLTLHDQRGVVTNVSLDPRDTDFLPYAKAPFFLVDAITAAEDMRFWRHDGFDWPLLVRALGVNLSSGRVVKGASTISQQLAKNLYLTMGRSLSRKLEEAIITWQLERTLPKERILEIYMNIIEMGPGLRGVNAGAELYFQKKATALSPLEAAHLASVIPAPTYYHQLFRKAVVKDDWARRIRVLLGKVHRYGRLPLSQLKAADKEELVIQDY